MISIDRDSRLFPHWRTNIVLLLCTLFRFMEADAGILSEVSVLRDTEHTQTIASVSADQTAFRPLSYGLNAGYTRAAHWLRFTVQREPGETGELWLELQPPYLDDIRLYEPVDDVPGQFNERRAGDSLPFAAREVPYRAFVFRLQPPDDKPHTYFLRLQTTSTSALVLKLWQPDAFHVAVAREAGFLGFYYGVMLVTLITNLVYWLWLRHMLYLSYVFYVAVTLFAQFGSNGLAAQYVLQDAPSLNNLWVGIGVFGGCATGGLFFSHLFSISRRNFWLYRLYQVQIALSCVLSLSLFTGHYTEAAMLTASLSMLAAALSCGYALRLFLGGVPGGIYLFASFLLFLAGYFPMMMTILGLLPGTTLLSLHGLQIATVGHVLIMNLAVSARINSLEQARQAALVRANEAEVATQQERRFRNHQNRFLGMLSHELKTPLSVIDSAAQSLRQLPGAEHPDVERRHQRIRKSVRRINLLLNQCLTQDRIDDAKLRLHSHILDVAELTREVAADRSEDDARLTVEAPSALSLQGDPILLRIALLNLIDNALKYSPTASPVQITVRAVSVDGETGVTIDVVDRGPGIPASAAETIFEPFVRGEQQGDIPGAGLGLYLVRRIAELHQGRICSDGKR